MFDRFFICWTETRKSVFMLCLLIQFSFTTLEVCQFIGIYHKASRLSSNSGLVGRVTEVK